MTAAAPLPDPRPVKEPPSETEMSLIDESRDRSRKLRRRVQLKYSETPTETGFEVSIDPPHSDKTGFRFRLYDAFGTTSDEFLFGEINRLCGALSGPGGSLSEQDISAAVSAIDGQRPDNEIEAMLLSQMAATHALAMDNIGRTKRAQSLDVLRERGNLLTKLQRTFVAQVEALSRLRRGGAQTVRVEHVHVHQGGQAIVGNVHTEGGGNLEDKRQSHETNDKRAVAAVLGSAMLSQNPDGDAMHASCGERQDEMPPARRRTRDWRPKG